MLVFSYGTLQHGFHNHHFMEKASKEGYVSKFAKNLIEIYRGRKEFLMKLIEDLKVKFDDEIVISFLEVLDSDKDEDIISAINSMS